MYASHICQNLSSNVVASPRLKSRPRSASCGPHCHHAHSIHIHTESREFQDYNAPCALLRWQGMEGALQSLSEGVLGVRSSKLNLNGAFSTISLKSRSEIFHLYSIFTAMVLLLSAADLEQTAQQRHRNSCHEIPAFDHVVVPFSDRESLKSPQPLRMALETSLEISPMTIRIPHPSSPLSVAIVAAEMV
jgi:hypothetical protein